MLDLRNARLDYETKINGIEFGYGQYLHVKQQNGLGAIFSIRRHRSHRANNCILYDFVIQRKSLRCGITKFKDRPLSDLERYLTSINVTFCVTNSDRDILEINNLITHTTYRDWFVNSLII